MDLVDVLALALIVLGCLLILFVLRRTLLRRSGARLDVCLRRSDNRPWVLGLARYDGDRLQWWRVFGLGIRPARTFGRADLVVCGQRPPTSAESRGLIAGAVIYSCRHDGAPVDLALSAAAVPGFLAWVESLPPGSLPPGTHAPGTSFRAS